MTRNEFILFLAGLLGWKLVPGGTAAPAESLPVPGPELAPWLEAWQGRPLHPLGETDDPLLRFLREAARATRPLELVYHGGSDPGRRRMVTPVLVATRPPESGPQHSPGGRIPHREVFLLAWCHTRQVHRYYRVDRLEIAEERPGDPPLVNS
jgi:hypothetical protein